MDTSKLSQFMSSGLITIIAFGVIILILKHWKEAAWLKIGSVIVIALILNDLATNNGQNIFKFVKWVLGLFGIQL